MRSGHEGRQGLANSFFSFQLLFMNLLCPPLEGHLDRVWHVAWHPSGALRATCSGDKTVRLWANGDANNKVAGNTHASSAASAAAPAASSSRRKASQPSSSSAAAQKDDEDEAPRWLCRAILEDAHKRTVRRAWSGRPTAEYLACASFDATVSIWENDNGGALGVPVAAAFAHKTNNRIRLHRHAGGPRERGQGGGVGHGGSLLATCSRDKSVWIWACALVFGGFLIVRVTSTLNSKYTQPTPTTSSNALQSSTATRRTSKRCDGIRARNFSSAPATTTRCDCGGRLLAATKTSGSARRH